MGATNCPETPRQKMITMMYLVYTAMLALNVSAEVVSGFKTVGNAMTKSNENLQTKIDDTYANFEQALKNSPEKVQDKYNKALEVKKLSIELENYIDSITYTFVGMLESKAKIYADPENPKKLTAEIDFKDANGNTSLDSVKRAMQLGGFSWISKLDNNHKGTAYFLGKAEGDHPQTGEIPKLIERIHEYKHKVNELLGEDSTHVTLGLDVDRFEVSSDKKSKSWEQSILVCLLIAIKSIEGNSTAPRMGNVTFIAFLKKSRLEILSSFIINYYSNFEPGKYRPLRFIPKPTLSKNIL